MSARDFHGGGFAQLCERFAMKFMWLVLLGLFCQGAWAKVEVTDDRGVHVVFASSPNRIVSLLPSLTETVCALGQCQRLVGVDRYSNYPAQLSRLPKVGGGLDPNVEAIVALKPDVVLMSVSSRVANRLEALGIRVLALETKSYDDVKRVVGRLGDMLGVPDAQRVWSQAQAGVQQAAQRMPPAVKKIRVYYEVNKGPYAAGESSFIGETLSRLGVQNIVPASLGPFPKLNPEFVVRANPDLIMISKRNAIELFSRPGWDHIRAIRENRVCVFSDEQADVLVRPGPRMAEAASIMADCVLSKGVKP
jgi:iron complex transport system substrate-binding protein